MTSCTSRCYEIGGPWITFDPECPVHGYDARRREAEHEDDKRTLEQEIADLKCRVDFLERAVATLTPIGGRGRTRSKGQSDA